MLHDADFPTPHLVGEFAAVLGRPKAFELHVDGVERTILLRLADRRVDDLLAVLAAFGRKLGRQVDVLKAALTANVQAKNVVKIAVLIDPLLHHLRERWSALGVESGPAGVGKLVNDLHAVLLGPLPDLVLLDRDRVLLPVMWRRQLAKR